MLPTACMPRSVDAYFGHLHDVHTFAMRERAKYTVRLAWRYTLRKCTHQQVMIPEPRPRCAFLRFGQLGEPDMVGHQGQPSRFGRAGALERFDGTAGSGPMTDERTLMADDSVLARVYLPLGRCLLREDFPPRGQVRPAGSPVIMVELPQLSLAKIHHRRTGARGTGTGPVMRGDAPASPRKRPRCYRIRNGADTSTAYGVVLFLFSCNT